MMFFYCNAKRHIADIILNVIMLSVMAPLKVGSLCTSFKILLSFNEK